MSGQWGTADLKAAYWGDDPVKKLYVGDDLLWSSEFTPTSIPGLGLWLDATALTPVADGTSVTSWADLSGAGHHMTPMATAPVYRPAGINGHPSVDFPGGDRRMLIPGFGTALANKTQYTLFLVLKPHNFSGRGLILDAPIGDSGWMFLVEFEASGGIHWGHYLNTYRTVRTTMSLGNACVLSFSHDNTTDSHLYQNGVEKVTESLGPSDMSAAVPPGVGANVALGGYYDGSLPMESHVGEILWYDHELTSGERMAVEAYLADKWEIEPPPGRPTQLPALPSPGPLPDHLK